MSLKQFPSHGKFSLESDRRHQIKDPESFNAIPPRLTATVFDVNRSWKMMRAKKKVVEGQNVALSGFKSLSRNDAARIAQAAGVRVTAEFSIEQAVADFGRMKLRELYAYVFFLALFTTATYLNRDFYTGNMIYNTARNAIINVRFDTPERPKNFREITQTEDFWDYLNLGMSQYLLRDGYDKDTLQPSEANDRQMGLLYVLRYNQLIQPIRIRQVRVEQQTGFECEANINIIEDFNECSPTYKEKYLDKTSYKGIDGASMPYKSGSQLKTAEYGRTTTSTYDGGGYVIDLPLLMPGSEVLSTFANLKKGRWIDKHTRAVMIDMVTYNPTNSFYLSVRLAFEFLPYGDVRPSYSFRIFKGDVISTELIQTILYILDLVAFCMTFLNVFVDLYRILNVGLRVHFRSNPYNTMNLMIYGLAIYVFVKKFEYLALPAVRALNEKGANTPWTEVYDYESVGWYYNEIECLTGYIALLCYLKLLDYLKYVSKRMAALVETIARCTYECGVWFFMLAVIIMGYSQAFYLALGPEIEGFDDFESSMGTMMIWIFDVVDYSQVLSTDQFLASFLFLSFQVVYSMLLVNMFIVILLRSYIDVKRQDFNDPIAAEIRKRVHVSMNRVKEKLLLFLATLSFNETSSNEGELDDQAHEMALATLKEEARANAFANLDDEEEELVVTEGALMDLVNELSALTTDMASCKKKVNAVTKRVNFQALLQGGGQEASGAGKVGDAKDATAQPAKVSAAARMKGAANKIRAVSAFRQPAAHGASSAEDSKGAHGDGQGGAVNQEGAGGGGASKAGGKGVSFAIAGEAFGKSPSRSSSSAGSSLPSAMAGARIHDVANRRARFDGMRGMQLQWLPSGCTDLQLARSQGKTSDAGERVEEGELQEGRKARIGSARAWS